MPRRLPNGASVGTMGVVRFTPALAVPLLVLAGCGGSAHEATPPPHRPVTIVGAAAKTVGAGTARFTLTITGHVGSLNISADESGTLAFTRQRAHIYRLQLSGGLPQEMIIDGPIEYTNGDVQAAMNDPGVKPWTKLDTRRLSLKQRLASENELAHVRSPAFLAEGLAQATRIGEGPGGTTHFRGTVDPVRLAARLPLALRPSIVAAVRNDYAVGPFPADFWIDSQGHVRRVRVSYHTGRNGLITVNATYSDFGVPVRLGLPPAKSIQDITP